MSNNYLVLTSPLKSNYYLFSLFWLQVVRYLNLLYFHAFEAWWKVRIWIQKSKKSCKTDEVFGSKYPFYWVLFSFFFSKYDNGQFVQETTTTANLFELFIGIALAIAFSIWVWGVPFYVSSIYLLTHVVPGF